MITFQTAQPEHAPHIAALVNSAYRGDSSKVGWTTEADLLDGQRTDDESIKNIILAPKNSIEMAIDSETKEILGLVHLKQEDNQTLYFGMLTVTPLAQSRGIGKLILKHIEDYAAANGFKNIRISVIHLRLELIAYYERRGFKPTGLFEPFPADNPLFGIPKVQDLKLLEFIKILH